MSKSMWNGRTAVITGASSGIGLEFARQVHARGSSVVLVARREDKLLLLADELNTKRPASAKVLAADLCREPQRAIVESFLRDTQVDFLINNAGFGSFGPFEELELQRELEMLELNVVSVMRLTHALLPQLKKRGQGGLIFVSSVAGMQALPFMSTYAATKAFDLFFALGLHGELKPFGIRVTAVCPGPVDTEFSGVARVSFAGGPRVSAEVVVRESLARFETGTPLVCPHWSAKLMSLGIRLSPRWLSAGITAGMMRKTLQIARG